MGLGGEHRGLGSKEQSRRRKWGDWENRAWGVARGLVSWVIFGYLLGVLG